MAELEIRFTETEVAQILWALSEAVEHAADLNVLSSVAMIEDTFAWSAVDSMSADSSSRYDQSNG